MKLSEIQKILKATVLNPDHFKDIEILGGGGADLMDDVLAAIAKDSVLLTGLNTIEVVRICHMAQIGAVVFVRGKKVGQDMLDQASIYSLPVLITTYSLFVACGRLYMNGLRGLDGSW